MKRSALWFGALSWAALAGTAYGQNPPDPLPMDERQRPAFAAFEPLQRLIHEVVSLERLSAEGKMKLSPAQARRLVPLLKDLASRKTIPPDWATKARASLRTLLDASQRKRLDAQAGPPPAGGPPPGGPFGPGGGSFNPFAPADPFVGLATRNLIARWGK